MLPAEGQTRRDCSSDEWERLEGRTGLSAEGGEGREGGREGGGRDPAYLDDAQAINLDFVGCLQACKHFSKYFC